VAKDLVSGKQGIVKLYDKSYAVIIGIDLYKNLSGLGDFVFIPREKDVLGDLTGASAARKNWSSCE
jgi:hypothetical protein